MSQSGEDVKKVGEEGGDNAQGGAGGGEEVKKSEPSIYEKVTEPIKGTIASATDFVKKVVGK